MKTDAATQTTTRYAVELFNEGEWLEMDGFSSDDYVKAYSGWEALNEKPFQARIIEVVTTTEIRETQVWPFAWTEQRDLCHYNGLADHDAHVINERRGQYCRGNGPFMADKDWRPGGSA